MNTIIDFHTHAFPDELAAKAMSALELEGDITAHLDGRVDSLLASMDKYGIARSVVCSIATKPSQFDPILSWSQSIASERIIPFPSIHPDDPDALTQVDRIRQSGFRGIKFHPYYQKFALDDRKMFPLYQKISDSSLIVVMHTGFDFAFPRERIADPQKIAAVMEAFPGLKLLTTHLGAWDDWDEVERLLIGKNIYMELSFSLEFLNKKRAQSIILKHPSDFILFGTDSPWTDQGNTLSLLRALGLERSLEKRILSENALQLLQTAGQ